MIKRALFLTLILTAACQLPTQVDTPITTRPSVSVAAVGSWTLLANTLVTKRYLAGSVTDTTTGLIYALGGYNGPGAIAGSGGSALTSVERYNPASPGAWTAVASMQFPHQGGAYAYGKNGKIYAFGGGPAASPQRVEAYDKNTNTWTTVSPMPTARAYFAASVDENGKIWIIGGYSGGQHLNRVEAYDPATDKWYSGPAMITARSRLAAATGSDGRIYALGGFDGSRALSVVEQLNPATLTWAAVTPLTTPRMDAAATNTSTGQIYILGGETFTGVAVSTRAEFFDPALNGWIAEPSLNTGRRMLGATRGTDGKIYAVAGANASDSAVNTVEVLTPTAITNVSIQLTSTAGANTINPTIVDTVRVSVLGSASLNVNTLLTVGTVFGGTSQVGAATSGNVNGDGFNDMTYKYISSAMSLPIGTDEGCIGGQTTGGLFFKGCRAITLSATARVWASIPKMPTARASLSLVTANDGRIFAIGGNTSSGAVATVEAYNPSTNTWATMASMPSARYGAAAVKFTDGKIYVAGGTNGTDPLTTTIAYTVTGTGANTWASVASMANERDGVSGALSTNGRIYVFGGTDDTATVYTSAQYYTTNAWTAGITAMAQARYDHATAAGSDARLYVFGGWSAQTATVPLTSVASFSPTGNSWTTETDLPFARAGLGATTDGSAILVAGGEDGSDIVNTTYQYNLSSNVWAQLPGMTSTRAFHGMATGTDGKIYVAGGYDDDGAFLSTVEVFTTQTNPGVVLTPLN